MCKILVPGIMIILDFNSHFLLSWLRLSIIFTTCPSWMTVVLICLFPRWPIQVRVKLTVVIPIHLGIHMKVQLLLFGIYLAMRWGSSNEFRINQIAGERARLVILADDLLETSQICLPVSFICVYRHETYSKGENEWESVPRDPLLDMYAADLGNKPEWNLGDFFSSIQDIFSLFSLSKDLKCLHVDWYCAQETEPDNVADLMLLTISCAPTSRLKVW